MARELGMTVAELGVRMSNREWVEQMAYDDLVTEARQVAALDQKLASDHARFSAALRR